MNKVEVIKCNDDINKMYDALKARSDRDYLFFKLAIHSGMKITELLTNTVEDTKRLI
ncbi:recombinase, partial [Staphylococcus aureus]|nr:recombinase [Staphylococcus aureus]